VADDDWELWITKLYYTPTCLKTDDIIYIQPKTIINKLNEATYSFGTFKITVIKELPECASPKMYKDKDGFIHFQINDDVHIWTKDVFDEEPADEHFNFLKKMIKWQWK